MTNDDRNSNEVNKAEASDGAPLTKRAKQAASQAGAAITKGSSQVARQVWADPLGRDISKAAALGAVIAIPIPFVSPLLGAALLAGIVAVRRLGRE